MEAFVNDCEICPCPEAANNRHSNAFYNGYKFSVRAGVHTGRLFLQCMN